MPPSLVAILGFVLLLPTALGFNWNYPVAARQCSTFSVVVNGTDVVFPLRILMVPVGLSPLAFEVRSVFEVAFPPESFSVNFTLPYPTGSRFVGLVADASGYRGTASTWTVLASTDASCFDATKNAVPSFTFALSPTEIAECQDVRIYWTTASIQGTPTFLSVIPDGAFAPIPLGKIDEQSGLGTGFTWRPPIRASTELIIVGGDTRGPGAGGFLSNIVDNGDPRRDSPGVCLAPTATRSSSRTASATPSATPSSSRNVGPTRTSTTNVGAVVGGVVGGLAVLGILFFILHRLLRKKPNPLVAPPVMQQQQHQFAPVAPNAGYYGGPGSYVPSMGPVPSPQPGWGVVPQEAPGQLPMQVAYTGQSAATAVTSSGFQGSSWKGSPAQTTGHWSASNDNVMRPTSWDGRA